MSERPRVIPIEEVTAMAFHLLERADVAGRVRAHDQRRVGEGRVALANRCIAGHLAMAGQRRLVVGRKLAREKRAKAVGGVAGANHRKRLAHDGR